MKRFTIGVAGALVALTLAFSPAHAAPLMSPCEQATVGAVLCEPVNAGKPLHVTGSVTATPGTGWPIGTVGSAVPTLAEMLGLNVGGTARGWSGLSTGAIFPAAVAIVDAAGAQVTSFGGSNASVSATGAAVPASATYAGLNNGGNIVGWTGVTRGAQNAASVQIVDGAGAQITTFGSPSITGWGGGTLGAMANYGTSPGAVLVPGVNSFITNTVTVTGAGGTFPVTGTFFQATQPVSAASGSYASGSVASGAYASGAISDGADVTLGAKADVAAGTGTVTAMAVLKQLHLDMVAATPAGTNAIGAVGALTKTVCVTPTVTNGTYAVNTNVGGLLTFTGLFTATHSGTIQSIVVNFSTAQTVPFFFTPAINALPNTTITDNATVALASTSNNVDKFSVRGGTSLANPKSVLGTQTTYNANGIGQAFVSSDANLYGILTVDSGTSATLGATANAMQICVKVLQDP